MEVGIREAKNTLSRLVEAALAGEDVFLTNRGERVAKLVPLPATPSARRGLGCLEGRVRLYPGWDSAGEDKKIEDMFEAPREPDSR
jgi:prevent-host-death family protein